MVPKLSMVPKPSNAIQIGTFMARGPHLRAEPRKVCVGRGGGGGNTMHQFRKIHVTPTGWALHCLDECRGLPREAEILGRIKDTVHEQGKPFNQDPRRTT